MQLTALVPIKGQPSHYHIFMFDGKRVGNHQTEVQKLLFPAIPNLKLVTASNVSDNCKWQKSFVITEICFSLH